MFLEMADDGLNGGTPFELALDLRRDAALLASYLDLPQDSDKGHPRPSFGLPELLVASHISRLASRDAAKSLLSTLVSESSGECRIECIYVRCHSDKSSELA
jgi:hypothetical protein